MVFIGVTILPISALFVVMVACPSPAPPSDPSPAPFPPSAPSPAVVAAAVVGTSVVWEKISVSFSGELHRSPAHWHSYAGAEVSRKWKISDWTYMEVLAGGTVHPIHLSLPATGSVGPHPRHWGHHTGGFL